MNNRLKQLSFILNSSMNDDDEIIVNEIAELKNLRKFTTPNINVSSSCIPTTQPLLPQDCDDDYDEENESEAPRSPQKKIRSSPDHTDETPSSSGSSSHRKNNNFHHYQNSINSQYNSQQYLSPKSMELIASKLKNLNDTSKSQFTSGSYQKGSDFEMSEQEVADKDNWDDSDEDLSDDDSQNYAESDYQFVSQFDEMRNNWTPKAGIQSNLNNNHHHHHHSQLLNHNHHHHHHNILPNNSNMNTNQQVPRSNHSTPSVSPKSHQGTPSRPFPTLDYKIKSEQVKQNPDGTYSCPYPTCNKTIKGNKGNLSSHLRWHRRLDAEAGEARGTNQVEDGDEEEFTTPLKPSQRGIQLRNQMIYYGLNLFRQDNQGKYLCFFEGCSLRMLTNFSRHIAKHERKGDKIKEELAGLVPSNSNNNNNNMGSPGSSPIKKSQSSPSSPTTTSSSFSPILSNSASTTPCQSPLTASSSSSSLYNTNNNQSESKGKRKLTVNTKFPSSNNLAFSAPCTPTTKLNNMLISSPRSLSSPSFASVLDIDQFRKAKLDSIIDGNNGTVINNSQDSNSDIPFVPSSSPISKKTFPPMSPTSSASSTPSALTGGHIRYNLPQVNLFKDDQLQQPSPASSTSSSKDSNNSSIQWVFNKPKKPNTPTSSSTPASPPFLQNLSHSSSSMAISSGAIAGIVIAIIVLIILWVLYLSIYIVHQAEGIVIERLGRFHKVLDSGINFVMPFFDSPRQFTWRKTYITLAGTISDEIKTSIRIDLRESVFNFLKQEVYTKDTVLLDVHALMYFRIYDIKKAIYEVDDLQGALSNTAQTQLKEVFGNMNFSEALESQRQINDHLVQEFSKLFSNWGIVVERMELLDLSPKSSISEAMKKQMVAERKRRGDFIQSEGQKAAMNLRAEGSKVVHINLGIAEQESTRKKSEGQAEASIELAQSESTSLELMSNVLQEEGKDDSQTNYMISLKYLDMLQNASNLKVIHLPFKMDGIQSILDDYTAIYKNESRKLYPGGSSSGSNNSQQQKNVVTHRTTTSQKSEQPKKEFSELD
eukprot:gene11947-14623_t